MPAQSEQDIVAIDTIEVSVAQTLTTMPVHRAIGVCLSFLLLAASSGAANRAMVRRALNESVIRQGFRGESMIEFLRKL